ncbi:SprB repeat-containing protein [Tenacibaculum agarivorans]|uniref:SprB repeat-containing protein n=1 Tax=Tenacibaculum agarivorans TaxID=1908389 RepID=UPI00094BBE2C|nr:SprB repeat-containing protein [Tenacibaculum agarivorans]
MKFKIRLWLVLCITLTFHVSFSQIILSGYTRTEIKSFASQSSTLSITLTATDVSCSGSSDGRIDSAVSGGNDPYTYELFDNDTGTIFASGFNNSFENLQAGNYKVEVTDVNGLKDSQEIIVSEPLPLSTTAALITSNEIIVTSTGGIAPYEYSINGGVFQTSDIFTNLVPGSYTVQSRDANGCVAESSMITVVPELVLTLVATDVSCSGSSDGRIDSAVSGGNQPYTYELFDNDTGTIFASGFNNSFENLQAGNYKLEVTDANGVKESQEIKVSEPSPLSITTALIASDEIAVTSTGGTAPYEYSINGGVFQTNDVFTNLVPGSYTIQVRDANGCIASSSTITIVPELVVTLVATDVSCSGSSDGRIDSTVSGGNDPYNYELIDDTGTIFASGFNSSFENLQAGNYKVEVTDANGLKDSQEITVSEPSPLSITTALIDSDEIAVTSTGGTAPYEYSINGSVFQSSDIFTNLVPGSYTVQSRDANGCIASSSTITIVPELVVTLVATDVSCSGSTNGRIDSAVSGGQQPYNYELIDDTGTIFASGFNSSFENLPAGNYKVEVTDANGVKDSQEITVSEPLPLSSTATLITSNEIIATSTGGTAPYEYSINGGVFQTNDVFTNLVPGSYTVQSRDANGCIANSSTIAIVPELVVTLVATDVSCSGSTDGRIDSAVSGGQQPYNYELRDNTGTILASGGNSIFESLSSGEYIVIVTDDQSNQVTDQITISEPNPITITVLNTISTGDKPSGQIEIEVIGGVGAYEYSYDGVNFFTNNTGNIVINDLEEGVYTVTINDSNNCIANSQEITIDTIMINNEVIVQNSSTLAVSFKGASSYQWINVDTKERISGATKPTYEPTVSGRYQVEMIVEESSRIIYNKSIIKKSTAQVVLSPVVEYDAGVLSVEEETSKIFKLYPNPAEEYLNVPIPAVYSVYGIYSIHGKELVTGTLLNEQLTVESLAKGVYVLYVRGYKPVRFVKK